jgi:hypothetical protein
MRIRAIETERWHSFASVGRRHGHRVQMAVYDLYWHRRCYIFCRSELIVRQLNDEFVNLTELRELLKNLPQRRFARVVFPQQICALPLEEPHWLYFTLLAMIDGVVPHGQQ